MLIRPPVNHFTHGGDQFSVSACFAQKPSKSLAASACAASSEIRARRRNSSGGSKTRFSWSRASIVPSSFSGTAASFSRRLRRRTPYSRSPGDGKRNGPREARAVPLLGEGLHLRIAHNHSRPAGEEPAEQGEQRAAQHHPRADADRLRQIRVR